MANAKADSDEENEWANIFEGAEPQINEKTDEDLEDEDEFDRSGGKKSLQEIKKEREEIKKKKEEENKKEAARKLVVAKKISDTTEKRSKGALNSWERRKRREQKIKEEQKRKEEAEEWNKLSPEEQKKRYTEYTQNKDPDHSEKLKKKDEEPASDEEIEPDDGRMPVQTRLSRKERDFRKLSRQNPTIQRERAKRDARKLLKLDPDKKGKTTKRKYAAEYINKVVQSIEKKAPYKQRTANKDDQREDREAYLKYARENVYKFSKEALPSSLIKAVAGEADVEINETVMTKIRDAGLRMLNRIRVTANKEGGCELLENLAGKEWEFTKCPQYNAFRAWGSSTGTVEDLCENNWSRLACILVQAQVNDWIRFTAETISARARSKSSQPRRLNIKDLIISARAAEVLGPLMGRRFEFFAKDLIESTTLLSHDPAVSAASSSHEPAAEANNHEPVAVSEAVARVSRSHEPASRDGSRKKRSRKSRRSDGSSSSSSSSGSSSGSSGSSSGSSSSSKKSGKSGKSNASNSSDERMKEWMKEFLNG